MAYDLELEHIIQRLKESKAKRALLQLPEGLKTRGMEIIARLERETGAVVTLQVTPVFGACDMLSRSRHPDAEFVIHVGHSPMPSLKPEIPTIFIEARSDLDVAPVVKLAARGMSGKIGLLTTVQHVHKLDEMRSLLEAAGLEVHIGKGGSRLAHPGQVLGCDFSAARAVADKVDSFLFVGTGLFHPLGAALATGKPVLAADPSSSRLVDLADAREKALRQRHGAIARAMDAKRFGILACTKPGQQRSELAESLKRELEGAGKEAIILSFDHLEPANLRGLALDAYVSTACPRLAIDDYLRFEQPILTPVELRVLLGKERWDGYRFDEIGC